jgi:hypothetical protein
LTRSWTEAGFRAPGTTRVRTASRASCPGWLVNLPREVWLGSGGGECPPGEGLRAAYVPSPFRFCLRCRVSYEQARGQDFAQAGHVRRRGPQFSRDARQHDFVQVTQIRGALYRAARDAAERRLRHDDVAQRVELALDPPWPLSRRTRR